MTVTSTYQVIIVILFNKDIVVFEDITEYKEDDFRQPLYDLIDENPLLDTAVEEATSGIYKCDIDVVFTQSQGWYGEDGDWEVELQIKNLDKIEI